MDTRKNRLVEAVLTGSHNRCFEQKYEKYQIFFSSEIFHFLVVKFSVYLNRHVFVMYVSLTIGSVMYMLSMSCISGKRLFVLSVESIFQCACPAL